MRVNKINTNINFRENTLSREMNSENAILMLRDTNATIRFKKNQEFAQKADSVDSNPLVALGYKLYRTFSMIKSTEANQAEKKQLDKIA